jgi:hypothetical protein
MKIDRTSNTEIVGFLESGNRWRSLPEVIDNSNRIQRCSLIAIDRTSNTKIVRFLEVDNRSIIPSGYKDAPQ